MIIRGFVSKWNTKSQGKTKMFLIFLFSCNCIQSNKREKGQVVMHTQPGRKDENTPQGHHQSREVKQNNQSGPTQVLASL